MIMTSVKKNLKNTMMQGQENVMFVRKTTEITIRIIKDIYPFVVMIAI